MAIVKEETLVETVPITPERKAQLEDYAQRRGKDAVTALGEVLAEYLESEREDYDGIVAAVMSAYEDVKREGRKPPMSSSESCGVRHGFPR